MLLASLSLLLQSVATTLQTQRIAELLALLVVTLGMATLGEYLFDWQLGIDELLFQDHALAYTSSPGRMASNSALAFVALGLALTVLHHQRWRTLVCLLTGLVSLIGSIALLGYLWNIPEIITDDWLPPLASYNFV